MISIVSIRAVVCERYLRVIRPRSPLLFNDFASLSIYRNRLNSFLSNLYHAKADLTYREDDL